MSHLFSPRVGDFDSRWAIPFALSFFWLAYWPKEIFFPNADFGTPLVKLPEAPDPIVALVLPLGVVVDALLSSLQMLVLVVGWLGGGSTLSGLSGMFAMSGLSSIVVYTLQ